MDEASPHRMQWKEFVTVGRRIGEYSGTAATKSTGGDKRVYSQAGNIPADDIKNVFCNFCTGATILRRRRHFRTAHTGTEVVFVAIPRYD